MIFRRLGSLVRNFGRVLRVTRDLPRVLLVEGRLNTSASFETVLDTGALATRARSDGTCSSASSVLISSCKSTPQSICLEAIVSSLRLIVVPVRPIVKLGCILIARKKERGI